MTGTHQPDKASVFCLQSISFTKEWQLTYLDLKTWKTAQEGFQSIGVTKEWRRPAAGAQDGGQDHRVSNQ